MTRTYLELGPVPAEEDCAQVGTDNYLERSQLESQLYIADLTALFPTATFRRRPFPHDFGTYHEVVVVFDDADPAACQLAYQIEESLPSNWSDTARAALVAAGYLEPSP